MKQFCRIAAHVDGAGYREALKIIRDAYGQEHRRVGTALSHLAGMLGDKGEFEAAEPLLRESLRIRQKTLPQNHWRIASTQSRLGDCLAKLGRYDEAEPHLLQSYETLRSSRGPAHAETVAALNRIIELYESWPKPDRAAEFRAMLPAHKDPAMLPTDEAPARLPTSKDSAAPSP